jgi:hypothetical protein
LLLCFEHSRMNLGSRRGHWLRLRRGSGNGDFDTLLNRLRVNFGPDRRRLYLRRRRHRRRDGRRLRA